MEYQKIFTEKYANQLQKEAKQGIGLDRYRAEKFNYDESKVLIIPTMQKPEGLLDKMDPTNDLVSAKALYEAYKNLTPLQASNRTFWIYLAHADLYEYMRKRWAFDDMKVGAEPSSFVLTHWFFDKGIMESSLASLWWLVKCSIDDQNEENPYLYTDYLFRDMRVRTRFGKSTIFRHNEAVIGIMRFIIDNDDVASLAYQERMLFITSYFNKLGAVKQLTFLDRQYFYDELVRIKPNIMDVLPDGRGTKNYNNDGDSDWNWKTKVIKTSAFPPFVPQKVEQNPTLPVVEKEPVEEKIVEEKPVEEIVTQTPVLDAETHNLIDKYSECFKSMRCSTKGSKVAPHKSILILSILELVNEKIIRDNTFVLIDELVTRFKDNWNKYIRGNDFTCNILVPLYYMNSDGFYNLEKKYSFMTFSAPQKSFEEFKRYYKGIQIDKDLFDLCLNDNGFITLKEVILSRIKDND